MLKLKCDEVGCNQIPHNRAAVCCYGSINELVRGLSAPQAVSRFSVTYLYLRSFSFCCLSDIMPHSIYPHSSITLPSLILHAIVSSAFLRDFPIKLLRQFFHISTQVAPENPWFYNFSRIIWSLSLTAFSLCNIRNLSINSFSLSVGDWVHWCQTCLIYEECSGVGKTAM
jgi:hypothetical protein